MKKGLRNLCPIRVETDSILEPEPKWTQNGAKMASEIIPQSQAKKSSQGPQRTRSLGASGGWPFVVFTATPWRPRGGETERRPKFNAHVWARRRAEARWRIFSHIFHVVGHEFELVFSELSLALCAGRPPPLLGVIFAVAGTIHPPHERCSLRKSMWL